MFNVRKINSPIHVSKIPELLTRSCIGLINIIIIYPRANNIAKVWLNET